MSEPTNEHPLTTKLRDAIASGDAARLERMIQRVNKEMEHPEMWGATEVGEALGISHTNMYKLADLPEAAITPARGKMWNAYRIKDFARQRRASKNPSTTEGTP